MYPSVSSDEDYSKIDFGKMFIDDSGVAKIKEKE